MIAVVISNYYRKLSRSKISGSQTHSLCFGAALLSLSLHYYLNVYTLLACDSKFYIRKVHLERANNE